MSISGILFFLFVVGWNLYKVVVKAREGRPVPPAPAPVKKVEPTAEQAGLSFADLYGVPTPAEHSVGISEGQTVEWAEIEREQERHVVEPTVQIPPAPASTPQRSATKPKHQPLLHQQNLKQAILLTEVLGEPRAKRPWRPNRGR